MFTPDQIDHYNREDTSSTRTSYPGRTRGTEVRNRPGIGRKHEDESRRSAHGDGTEPGTGRYAGAAYLRTVHLLSALPGFLGIDRPAGLRRTAVRPEPALPLQQDQHETPEHRVHRGVAPGPVLLPPDQPRFGVHPLLPRRHLRGERLPEGHSPAPHGSADESQHRGVLPGQGHGGGGRFRGRVAGRHRGHGDLHERHDAPRFGINSSDRPRKTLILSYRAADAFPIHCGVMSDKVEAHSRLVRGERASQARFTMADFPIPRYEDEVASLYDLQERSRKSA